MVNSKPLSADSGEIPVLGESELPDRDLVCRVIDSGLPAFVAHRSVDAITLALTVEAHMGEGWQVAPDLELPYPSHSVEHIDGLNLNPYWLLHTTRPDGDNPAGSRFTFRRYRPMPIQHGHLLGTSRLVKRKSWKERNTNQSQFHMVDIKANLSKGYGGLMPELPVDATFVVDVPAAGHIVFINGYDASTEVPGYFFTHEVQSVDIQTGEPTTGGRKVDAYLIEPIEAIAKATNKIGVLTQARH